MSTVLFQMLMIKNNEIIKLIKLLAGSMSVEVLLYIIHVLISIRS